MCRCAIEGGDCSIFNREVLVIFQAQHGGLPMESICFKNRKPWQPSDIECGTYIWSAACVRMGHSGDFIRKTRFKHGGGQILQACRAECLIDREHLFKYRAQLVGPA